MDPEPHFNKQDTNTSIQTQIVPQSIDFYKIGQQILKFWQQSRTYQRHTELNSKHSQIFRMYDGPPFPTGVPHMGHIGINSVKDVYQHYMFMRGFKVIYQQGWDCHGVAIQHIVNKIMDINTIDQRDIKQYNSKCREFVQKYIKQWSHVMNQFGRWVDNTHQYRTMDIKYMESVWAVFKSMYQNNLIKKQYKLVPCSTSLQTPLSNMEAYLNVKQIQKKNYLVLLPLLQDKQTYFVVFCKYLWALPCQLAVVVNPKLSYVKIRDINRNKILIAAQKSLPLIYGKNNAHLYQIQQTFIGSTLQNIQYIPFYQYFEYRRKGGCFRVLLSQSVDDHYSGIVSCVPSCNQHDYQLCINQKIINQNSLPVPVDQNGKFTKQIPKYQGIFYEDVELQIIQQLKSKNIGIHNGKISYTQMLCWRSDTPLIYRPVQCWFVSVDKIKDRLLQNNANTSWFPKSIKDKKFTNYIKDAKDYCISRTRMWGTPIPIWISDDKQQIVCIGSIKQLQLLTGHKINDLHRESIDHLTIESKKGKGTLKRVKQVLDCWFESGCMPYGQAHYPFQTSQQQITHKFQADLIVQGIDQTRCWFYMLNLISTAMHNISASKNIIACSLIMQHDNKWKMQKKHSNYSNPLFDCQKYGTDVIRLYLISCATDQFGYTVYYQYRAKDINKMVLTHWYQVYRFLIKQIGILESKTSRLFRFDCKNQIEISTVINQWIISSFDKFSANVIKQMDEFRLKNIVNMLTQFIFQEIHCYARFIKLQWRQYQTEFNQQHMDRSLRVLFSVLLRLNILMSPLVPFLTEYMFQNMRKYLQQTQGSNYNENSIHNLVIPNPSSKFYDHNLQERMSMCKYIIKETKKIKQLRNLQINAPLSTLTVMLSQINYQKFNENTMKQLLPYIKREVNVEQINFKPELQKYVIYSCTPCLPVLAPKLKGNNNFSAIRNQITRIPHERILQFRRQLQKQQHRQQITNRQSKIMRSAQQQQNYKIEQQQQIPKQLLIQIQNYQINISKDIIINAQLNTNILQNYQSMGGKYDYAIVILDCRTTNQVIKQHLRKLIENKIINIKRQVDVQNNDKIVVFYHIAQGSSSQSFKKILQTQKQLIQQTIGCKLINIQNLSNQTILAKQKITIDQCQCSIILATSQLVKGQMQKQLQAKSQQQQIN